MPMNFPTYESLRNRAASRHFRQPHTNETENDYREALADYMRFIDPVESSEIRSGLGWDKQSPLSVLAGSLGQRQTEPLYLIELTVPDVSELPENIVSGLSHTEVNGVPVIQYDFYHGKEKEYEYNQYSDEPKERIAIETHTEIFIGHPKLSVESVQAISCGGNWIALVKLTNVYTVDFTGDKIALVNGVDTYGLPTKTPYRVKFHREMFIWSVNHVASYTAVIEDAGE